MSTFDHPGLMQDINEGLKQLRTAQTEAMQGFAQLSRTAMAEGAISSKHKELMALAIGVTQHCSGYIVGPAKFKSARCKGRCWNRPGQSVGDRASEHGQARGI